MRTLRLIGVLVGSIEWHVLIPMFKVNMFVSWVESLLAFLCSTWTGLSCLKKKHMSTSFILWFSCFFPLLICTYICDVIILAFIAMFIGWKNIHPYLTRWIAFLSSSNSQVVTIVGSCISPSESKILSRICFVVYGRP